MTIEEVDLRGEKVEVRWFTPVEAESEGLLAYNSPCEPGVCKYCGKVIEPRGFLFMEKIFWVPILFACECAKAQKDRIEYERMTAGQQAAEDKKRKTEQLYIKSGMKERSREQTFDTFEQNTDSRKEAWWDAHMYAMTWETRYRHGQGLHIEGNMGTGKTHLANAIANMLISKDVAVVFTTPGDMLREVKQAYDNNWGEIDVLKRFEQADLLILDDMGKERCTDWSMSILFNIFNERYMSKRPTITTTNLRDKALAMALTPDRDKSSRADDIISRIRQMSKPLVIRGADARLEMAGT